MSRQLPSLHSKGDIHKVLLLQQRLEGGDEVRLVVVPAQAEPLVGAHGGRLFLKRRWLGGGLTSIAGFKWVPPGAEAGSPGRSTFHRLLAVSLLACW